MPPRTNAADEIQVAIADFRAGRFQQAEAACGDVLRADPQNASALHVLGLIAHQTGRHDRAIELVRRAIVLKPRVPDFHNNLGNILAKLGRLEEAQAAFQRAIVLNAEYPEAHNNLANVFSRQGQLDAALANYRKAIQIKPGYVEAIVNLANACRRLGRFDEAAECSQKALEINPRNAEAHRSLALAYEEQGRMKDALAAMDNAIAHDPANPRLRFGRALMLLHHGDWEQGWAQYEWRWRLAEYEADTHRFKEPLWEGQGLSGRTLLLRCEQGLGSTLQFIRYAPLLAQRGGRVIVECQPVLKELLACLASQVQIIARGEALPPFDLHLPLLSVPRVFKTTVDSVPKNVPYLSIPAELRGRWAAELGTDTLLKVGIAWQGNPAFAADAQRSIPLRAFARFAAVAGVRLFSLQKIQGMEQISACGADKWLTDLAPRMDPKTFVDTAAVIQNLDLVVTSDTSIAHLAGAMGVRVWVALCSAADWRWLSARDDSPWYPSMRLFRQDKAGDWDQVFGRIATALAGKVEKQP